jgi:non-canonical purine NTP pyrophosphatase (RdgB/HAM1 family)
MGSPRAVFVTSNANKRREAAAILGVELESAPLDLPEIQSLDFAEVAAEKARAARAALDHPEAPVLVEDSGLIVEAWNGLPGALTKWFIKSVGHEGILRMLPPGGDRSARAVCVVAVALAASASEPEDVRIFRGEVPGTLADAPRGERGRSGLWENGCGVTDDGV